MPRDYYEPTSYDDDLFEAEEAAKRADRRKQAEKAGDALAAEEARQAAALRARIDERAAETNRRQVIAEYQAAGVEPLRVDGNGRPTVSLSMLLRIGWTIENISGKNVLIYPPGYRPPHLEEPVFGAPRIEEIEDGGSQ